MYDVKIVSSNLKFKLKLFYNSCFKINFINMNFTILLTKLSKKKNKNAYNYVLNFKSYKFYNII